MSSYAYGPASSVPRRRNGMRTAGRWMFIVGLVLSLVTLGVTVWGASQAWRTFSAMESDLVAVEGATTVPMPERSMRAIVTTAAEDPSCTVTAPDGSSVPTAVDGAVMDMASGEQFRVVGTITADEAGDYTVECTGGQAQVTGALPATAVIGISAAALGVLALVPLGLITLLGLILWLVGRSRDRKAALATGAGYSQSHGHGQERPPYPGSYGSYGSGGAQGYGQSPARPTDPPAPEPGRAPTDPWAPPPPPGQGRPAEGPGDETR